MLMRLTFIGADHEVTGSCHFLEVGDTKVLIDCGMEQGNNPYQNAELPVSYSDIDYVFLTHAHIDHAGMLPWIYARGFKGQIITTYATADLCGIMLRDSAHIQEMEAEWRNRKARRAGKAEVEALYTMQDAEGVLGHFEGVAYDYVVMESTYGNRYHKKGEDHVVGLARIIQETLDRKGNVVIPAFAVGRTQELLYMIRHIKEKKLVTGHDGFQVYVDSPLAVEATHVFKQNMVECYDEETKALVERGINPIDFPGLKLSVTSEESKNINFDMTPKVIISAAGMCDAGRIRHHLKHNLWREECSVVFAGYQAEGTLGRLLQDGTPAVKIFGEEIDVKAHIETLDGISGHADRDGLLTWAAAFEQKPKYVFVVHGNDESCESLTDALTTQLGLTAKAPYSGSEFDLIRGLWIRETEPVLVEAETQATRKATGIYTRLVDAGQMLMDVIARNQGGANQDLKHFTEQILALCEKWNR